MDFARAWSARLLPVAVVVVAFGLGELAARLAIWWQYGSPDHEVRVVLDYAPYLITAGEPASYAFRPRTPGVRRVLWLGSSSAQQFTREELVGAFRQLYPEGVEVLNLAQGGYNSSQELVMLALHGMQLRPDLLVTLNGVNDIIGLTKTGRPGIPYLDLTIERAMTHPTLFWVERLFARSQLVNAVRKMGERRLELAVQGRPELLTEAVSLYAGNVLKMAQVAQGLGVRHVAILQPYQFSRKNPPPVESPLGSSWSYRARFMVEAMNRLHDEIGSRGFPESSVRVNGLTAFDDTREVCFADEAHLTPEGRRILLAKTVELMRRTKTAGSENDARSPVEPPR